MKPVFLVDLDDTLFQTAGKCPGGTAAGLVQVTDSRTGRHSFQTPVQQTFTRWLLDHAEVIPVTARSLDAWQRVQLPFTHGAIIGNGAVILRPDGTPDPDWAALLRADLPPFADALHEVQAAGEAAARRLNLPVRSWIAVEDGLDTYLVFKETAGEGARLTDLSAALPDLPDWISHLNGNNLALIPPPLSKRRASAWLIGKIRAESPDRPILGLADSLSDLGFLDLCDWWGTPARSQLASVLPPEARR